MTDILLSDSDNFSDIWYDSKCDFYARIVFPIINEIFKWYALHKTLVRGLVRAPFIIVSTVSI